MFCSLLNIISFVMHGRMVAKVLWELHWRVWCLRRWL